MSLPVARIRKINVYIREKMWYTAHRARQVAGLRNPAQPLLPVMNSICIAGEYALPAATQGRQEALGCPFYCCHFERSIDFTWLKN